MKPAFLAAFFLALAILFGLSLPLFIQGGDTSELVAAAYLKLVAHPPGYPLWIWLEHAWVQLPLFTIFWRASLLSAIFALLTLGLVAANLRKQAWSLWLCLPLLALSTPFAESALLPDVFSLHALFVAAICSAYLYLPVQSPWRQTLIPFLLFFGLSHHLTIVLMLPLLGALAWESRTSRSMLLRISIGAGAGIILSLFAYWSLLLLHPTSPFSWGELTTIPEVWEHFLRTDYGTFSLSSGSSGLSPAVLLHFLRYLAEVSPPIFLAGFALFHSPALRKNPRILAGLLSWALSLAFLLALNVKPERLGAEVLLRFYVAPLVQGVILAGFILQQASLSLRARRIAYILALPCLIFLCLQALGRTALRKDSVIEDYAYNLLTEAEQASPSLVLAESDHAYFALQYGRSVFGLGGHVAVASPSLFFHPWYLDKINASLKEFRLPHKAEILAKRKLDLEADLIEPNISSQISFLLSRNLVTKQKYLVSHLGLGLKLTPGAGESFSEQVNLRIGSAPRELGPQWLGKKILFAQYANYFLESARAEFMSGHPELALKKWKSALAVVPYAWPALENICRVTRVQDEICGDENILKVRKSAQGIYVAD
ncbi:MAG: protein O-mannosyl-transferase family [Bdellovibrionota bacterium]